MISARAASPWLDARVHEAPKPRSESSPDELETQMLGDGPAEAEPRGRHVDPECHRRVEGTAADPTPRVAAAHDDEADGEAEITNR